ncbi:ABC transporter permease [Corynebacterium variabile]|uniref:ABC transporter permease n=1 Tax=Corynebacterium variabile TaxID=1727 RepID=UPI001D3B9037|nr:ABC transporter permease [Corynebacterium variabile]HJG45196.1 ABC transporter permease [Corynebacterium variabile]
MTTATTPRSASRVTARTTALARAETLQFARNRTLLINAAVFPLGFGLVMFFVTRATDDASTTDAAAMALEYFLVFALMFVQFYTVLSMATTRRDEGVMKRLRTGEARDAEILGAFSFPGAVLTVLFTVVMAVALVVLGAPGPVNILPIIVAVLLGLAVCTGLALVTSGMTKNAEAAQITSLPVMILMFASMGSIRQMFPDSVNGIIERTPFALIFDLSQYGWAGNTMTDRIAEDGPAPLDFTGVLSETWPLMVMLAAWAVVCLWAGAKYVKWDVRS